MVDHGQITPRTRMTSAEFLALPESNLPMELLNGEVLMSPAPTAGHQHSVRQAFKVVDTLIPDGEVFFAPADVFLMRTLRFNLMYFGLVSKTVSAA